MDRVEISVVDSLDKEIKRSDAKTQKLFGKQKQFMEINPNYPSLGRTKLKEVEDKYGNPLWEIRLDGKRRIVFVDKGNNRIVWLKICNHDELKRNNKVVIQDNYK
jgi:mRNA-degrading endonuclease RelE of RelBE toxin-antitoxin system